ncbi:MAG: ATP-binding protein [Candidatus Omnitrophica bacterium]|jgi:signal transduction histidine kinase|nr:ATP-binding protein [Candidatus Omnitrophota bacterium]
MNESLLNIIGIGSIITVFSLIAVLIIKMEQLKHAREFVVSLQRSLDEMDEQAKLIVRTDMELNKAQEELDRKVGGLYVVQRLSRTLSTNLEENQLFRMISAEHLEDLGFEKACGFLWSEKELLFRVKFGIGYSQQELDEIKNAVNIEKEMYHELIQNKHSLSSVGIPEETQLRSKLENVFRVRDFVIAPILPREGERGMAILGTRNPDATITDGTEEMVNIFATQLGQSLENARLFEKTWKAQQDLERKVEERTRALQKALDELNVISKRKSDFISAVSHELRTPLTSIKGYASILLAGKLGAVPEEIRLRLDKINRHSDELTYMVNDLLDIARIESGKITMNRTSQNLKEALPAVFDLLAIQLKEKQIQYSFETADNADMVLADAQQLNRVFINLISNALKFTPIAGKITVKSRLASHESVQIDISDNGCGIPDDAKEAIFDEFYRVDNLINQTVKGTGLGLSLVKKIIEAHQGHIWVQDNPGGGATFSFVLPKA